VTAPRAGRGHPGWPMAAHQLASARNFFLDTMLFRTESEHCFCLKVQSQQSRHQPRSRGLDFAEPRRAEVKPGMGAGRAGKPPQIHGDLVTSDRQAKTPTRAKPNASAAWSRYSVTLRFMTGMLILVANFRRGSRSRSLGRMGTPAKEIPRVTDASVEFATSVNVGFRP
jgi:hypothetical protein